MIYFLVLASSSSASSCFQPTGIIHSFTHSHILPSEISFSLSFSLYPSSWNAVLLFITGYFPLYFFFFSFSNIEKWRKRWKKKNFPFFFLRCRLLYDTHARPHTTQQRLTGPPSPPSPPTAAPQPPKRPPFRDATYLCLYLPVEKRTIHCHLELVISTEKLAARIGTCWSEVNNPPSLATLIETTCCETRVTQRQEYEPIIFLKIPSGRYNNYAGLPLRTKKFSFLFWILFSEGCTDMFIWLGVLGVFPSDFPTTVRRTGFFSMG